MSGTGKIIATYKIWDIPYTTKRTLEAIVDKHPNKNIFVVVWEPKEKEEK